ncbi:response regulator [Qipengyuania gaetbuli]|jgi:two-component system, LuxR family, response regulator FixJ|uniref:response regulator FixJ n=1 Tax=Qipengyuania gaetbuli TaxID=266952 RepID=UPI001C98FA3A|nr:response regulator FixJ [Qipengyuania gaetbuli]MBY6016111.1 response regulator [Qipengyuania gaetbuli]
MENDALENSIVYVIDDDESARSSLEFLLDVAGVRVRSFASGDQFLKSSPPLKRACIITDVRMPGMGGVDLTRRVKDTDPSVPVIVITGHADVPMAIDAMRAGASDFIEKPFEENVIISAIRRALSEKAEGDAAVKERREIEARLSLLSAREHDVVEGLVEGKANKMIAFDLDISPRTVEVYRANAMKKLQAKTLSDLVRMVTIARLS